MQLWCMQGPKEIGDVDTDDEKDEEAQYEQWKSREMTRIRCAWQHSLQIPAFHHVIQHATLTALHQLGHFEVPHKNKYSRTCSCELVQLPCWFCASVQKHTLVAHSPGMHRCAKRLSCRSAFWIDLYRGMHKPHNQFYRACAGGTRRSASARRARWRRRRPSKT